jgi:hypothetical protein
MGSYEIRARPYAYYGYKNYVVYKVTFEYGNEPEAVKDYIQVLRDLLESYREQ